MRSHVRKLSRLLIGSGLAAFMVGAGASGAIAAGGGSTCTGGSVAPGTYSSLVIAGACAIDSGSATVLRNLTVRPGADLYAAFSGSDLTVGGNLDVKKNGVLVLGCEPDAFPCFNDPNGVTNDVVGKVLTAEGALAVLVHHSTLNGNVVQSGGGGGLNCDPQPPLMGSPAYATYEDDAIGGNVSITGWRSCWLGFFRETVAGNVAFNNNQTFDPDGNEVATNTIDGGLHCQNNSPAPQLGDSGGTLNIVHGRVTGQCIAVT
jgi:hypothetical protein